MKNFIKALIRRCLNGRTVHINLSSDHQAAADRVAAAVKSIIDEQKRLHLSKVSKE